MVAKPQTTDVTLLGALKARVDLGSQVVKAQAQVREIMEQTEYLAYHLTQLRQSIEDDVRMLAVEMMKIGDSTLEIDDEPRWTELREQARQIDTQMDTIQRLWKTVSYV